MTSTQRLRLFALTLMAALVFPVSSGFAVDLPPNGPKPRLHRQAAEKGPDVVPVPDRRPEPQMLPVQGPPAPEQSAAPDKAPDNAPLPDKRPEPEMRPVQGPPPPEQPGPEKTASQKPGEDAGPPDHAPLPEPDPRDHLIGPPAPPTPPKPATLPDPRSDDVPDPSGTLPATEAACRARLTELGVSFKEAPAESDPHGCSIPYPLKVESLGGEIDLSPDAEMNCAMAEAAARFMKDAVHPAAEQELGAGLKSIGHASAYVCRPRNGTNKLSEHAFGNALDIATFNLKDGRSVQVEATTDEKIGKFLAAVRKAACGPFKTVLGPGSDADHALHFHLDLQPRRNGSTFCQ